MAQGSAEAAVADLAEPLIRHRVRDAKPRRTAIQLDRRTRRTLRSGPGQRVSLFGFWTMVPNASAAFHRPACNTQGNDEEARGSSFLAIQR